MIIKKTYSENDWVIIKVTNSEDGCFDGIVLDCQDPDGWFEVGEEASVLDSELVEVIGE